MGRWQIMSNAKVIWKYVHGLKDRSAADMLAIDYCFRLPESLKACIREHNAGMPVPSKIDSPSGSKYVFGGLLSFNKGDADSVYDYIGLFKNEDGTRLKMFPFGLDPFGNFFCVKKDGSVVFWNHEDGAEEQVSPSFDDFVASLHA
jgi:hypothetical protein